MKYNFKKMGHYEVSFWDHCVGFEKPMLCKVSGYLINDTSSFIMLTTWVVVSDDDEVVQNNIEPVVILKSTIKSVRKLDR